jgi:hypothetical protein
VLIRIKATVINPSDVKQETGLSRRHEDTEMKENEIGTIIADCTLELHRDLGPGLLETVYELTWPGQWSFGVCMSSGRLASLSGIRARAGRFDRRRAGYCRAEIR